MYQQGRLFSWWEMYQRNAKHSIKTREDVVKTIKAALHVYDVTLTQYLSMSLGQIRELHNLIKEDTGCYLYQYIHETYKVDRGYIGHIIRRHVRYRERMKEEKRQRDTVYVQWIGLKVAPRYQRKTNRRHGPQGGQDKSVTCHLAYLAHVDHKDVLCDGGLSNLPDSRWTKPTPNSSYCKVCLNVVSRLEKRGTEVIIK